MIKKKFCVARLLPVIVAVIATTLNSAFAESPQFIFHSKTITVGKQPTAIFPDGSENVADYKTLNVICLGYDANWDDVFDEETDELPSWWKIKNISHPNTSNSSELVVEKVMDFEFNGIGFFPFRCVSKELNKEYNILFIPHNDFVVRYNILTTQVIDTIKVAGVKAASILNNYIFFSVREYAEPGSGISNKNYVIKYDTNFEEVADTIFTGYNVQKTIPYIDANTGDSVLAVLCEGAYGSEDSYLEFYNISSSGNEINEKVLLGSGSNDMLYVPLEFTMGGTQIILQFIVAVVSNSHKLQIVDAQTYSTDIPILAEYGVPTNISLPTSGWDVAREIGGNQNKELFLTTYNGKIYRLAPLNNGQIDSVDVGVATEGLTVPFSPQDQNDIVLAYTKIYDGIGTYGPGNEIVIGFTENSCINEEISNLLSLSPNPVSETATLALSKNEIILSAVLVDITGHSLLQIPVIGESGVSSISFRLPPSISSGVYYLVVKTSSGNGAIKFVVNR